MRPTARYNPEATTGWRMEQLARAFDRVMNARDWKGPVEAVIRASDRLIVEKAIVWFTHTVPSFEAVPGEPDQLLVRARGYDEGEGAHHRGEGTARYSEELRSR